MVQLRAAIREADILWDTPAAPLVEPLSAQVRELFSAVSTFADSRREHADATPLTSEQRDVLYSRGSEDAYSERLMSNVANLEEYVAPHLPRRRRHRGRHPA